MPSQATEEELQALSSKSSQSSGSAEVLGLCWDGDEETISICDDIDIS